MRINARIFHAIKINLNCLAKYVVENVSDLTDSRKLCAVRPEYGFHLSIQDFRLCVCVYAFIVSRIHNSDTPRTNIAPYPVNE